MNDECGKLQREQAGYFCAVCGDHIPRESEVWKENADGERVTCHESCEFHTCEGMTAAAQKKT